jgi:3-oxoacyl-(acyl-carrier-protein) synthase
VDPASVAFVAIHGTGTPLGDPIEVNALSQPLTSAARPLRPVAMLSNKACYGHTEGTAGITGLLLALQVRAFPSRYAIHCLLDHVQKTCLKSRTDGCLAECRPYEQYWLHRASDTARTRQ